MGKPRVKVGKILFTRQEIDTRLDELAAEIQQHYRRGELTVVAVLKGSLIFTADLVRRLDLPIRMDILEMSSYHDDTSPVGEPELSSYVVRDVHSRHVLVMDDIVDTGATLAGVLEILRREGPRSLATCVFLNKTPRRKKKVNIDFCGFELNTSKFVVGYGLDYAQRYRNLPYLAELVEPRKVAKKATRRRSTKKRAVTQKRSRRKKASSSKKRTSGRRKTRKKPPSSRRGKA